MRGTKVKQIKKFSAKIFHDARQHDPDNKFFTNPYLYNEKSGQIICAGFRGIYRAIKKMYRNNVEVPI